MARTRHHRQAVFKQHLLAQVGHAGGTHCAARPQCSPAPRGAAAPPAHQRCRQSAPAAHAAAAPAAAPPPGPSSMVVENGSVPTTSRPCRAAPGSGHSSTAWRSSACARLAGEQQAFARIVQAAGRCGCGRINSGAPLMWASCCKLWCTAGWLTPELLCGACLAGTTQLPASNTCRWRAATPRANGLWCQRVSRMPCAMPVGIGQAIAGPAWHAMRQLAARAPWAACRAPARSNKGLHQRTASSCCTARMPRTTARRAAACAGPLAAARLHHGRQGAQQSASAATGPSALA